MRTVDADALEKEGWSLHRTIRVDKNTEEYQTKPLRKVPTIEPEPHWIPCSKALPQKNGVYVVTRNISDGFECRNITDACYFDGADTWHDDTRVNHSREYLTDVLAWMPLPEPYKEGE